MIDQELLEILACPEDKTPLRLADDKTLAELNEAIAAGTLTNRGGDLVEEPVDAGLVREDGRYLYAIRDDIPIMLIDEAIPLSPAEEG
ncbi:MAG TPA: Trm112 family protein [Acidobacteriota bacterium]|nr:Trm112 family protein [Acidobacteriota bacterium]